MYNIYIINPSFENIKNSEIFKLEINDDTIYVPLWHQEMIYENSIIKIHPLLPTNITIDDFNNIHIIYNNKFTNLLKLINEDINFIEIDNYTVNLHELKLKKNQIITLKNKGIPLINSLDILDNKIRGNVLIHINLE